MEHTYMILSGSGANWRVWSRHETILKNFEFSLRVDQKDPMISVLLIMYDQD